MARSQYGNDFYPAAPLQPSGVLTDFDVQASELARRRRMAQLLQQQGMNPLPMPHNAPGSWLAPIAQMAQVWAGKSVEDDANKQERADNQVRNQVLAEQLGKIPTEDIPARPENAPVGVEGEAPIGPILPARPGQTVAQQMIPWALETGRIGGPFGQKIAEGVVKPALERLLPISPDVQARLDETKELRISREADAQARREDARTKQIEAMQLKDRELAQQLTIHKDNNALRQQIEADRNENRLALKALIGAVSGESAKDSNLIGEKGERLVINKQGELRATNPDGTISKTPYAGATTPRTTIERNVAQIQETQRGVAEMEGVLSALKTDAGKAAFSPRAAVGSFVPNVAGVGTAIQGLEPEQVTLRAQAASSTANVTHSLYGSAFSAGEQQRAKDFLIGPRDDAPTVEAKLKGRLKLEKDHLARQPGAAQAAAAARAPGDGSKRIRFDAQGNELP